MKEFLRNIIRGDKVIWAIFAFFCLISLIEVYSASSILSYKDGRFWSTFLSHGFHLLLGTLLVWGVHLIPFRYFRAIPLALFIPIVIVLGWALVGGETINGGARWLRIPFIGITFQPSEIAKGVLVTTVALILTTSQEENGARKSAFTAILIATGIICGLIVTQNFSTAAMIFLVVFMMMIIGRVPTRQLLSLAGVGIVGLGLAYSVMMAMPSDPHDDFYSSRFTGRFSTWRARLTSSDMNTDVPASDFVITDHNRQEVHGLIAIARSNGAGVMPGNSVERDYLAQADSDFIYAIISEELGIVGAGFVLILYIILLIRAGRIASACKRNFPSFLVMGLALLLVTQAMVNMLVAVGIFPVTGQTLPLISRGGTSTLFTCIYFGMILSISTQAEREKKKAQAAREAMLAQMPEPLEPTPEQPS